MYLLLFFLINGWNKDDICGFCIIYMYFFCIEFEFIDISWDLYLLYGLVNVIVIKNVVEIYLGVFV